MTDTEFTDWPADDDRPHDDLAARFAEKMCSAWDRFNLPPEPMLRAVGARSAKPGREARHETDRQRSSRPC
jgi:hypothetical protein